MGRNSRKQSWHNELDELSYGRDGVNDEDLLLDG